MILLRRFLVVQLLMLWQGGFLFYASVVVPIGTDVLGGSFAQGQITQQVTYTLNSIGLTAMAVCAWELFYSRRLSRRRRLMLYSSWILMTVGVLTLIVIHRHLDEVVSFHSRSFSDRTAFRYWHRAYLWISTVQWIAGLVFALFLLLTWQSTDRRMSP